MGKPRMIILVRHAQSEGNKNRDIHQYIADHRVKLTPDGWQQAEESGRRLRSMLRPDDTLQFYTSPYRRTRETTDGILRTLTGDDPEQGPSPFPMHKIKVYEEPRLREQDFGNFQPCSAEMERMWQERADYGHFFYRIPNGESAADAYDRVSGFNESLWRQFGETDFPSVCVLVTHGLMTRIFLMKWYHWSVEYFEDLRNVNHCEFIVMKQNPDNGKYILQNELRTWSDLKRRTAAAQASSPSTPANPTIQRTQSMSYDPSRRWGGCANGCNHAKLNFPRRVRRQNTLESVQTPEPQQQQNEKEDHPIAAKEEEKAIEGGVNITGGNDSPAKHVKKSRSSSKSPSDRGAPLERADTNHTARTEPLNPPVTKEPTTAAGVENDPASNAPIATEDLPTAPSPPDSAIDTDSEPPTEPEQTSSADPSPSSHRQHRHKPATLLFGSSRSDLASPASCSDDDSDYFDTNVHQFRTRLFGLAAQSKPTTLNHAHAPSRSNASRSILAQMADEGKSGGVDGESDPMSPRSAVSSTGGGLGRSGSRKSLRERTGSKGWEGDRPKSWLVRSGRNSSVAEKTGEQKFEESGMMFRKKADALGDVDPEDVDDGDGLRATPGVSVTEAVFEQMKARERKGFEEVY